MTDSWLVTTDPDEIRTALAEAKAVGFDEVEIHSASPDQKGFVEMMGKQVLPKI